MLAPTAPAPTSSIKRAAAGPLQHPNPLPHPQRSNERTVGFDKTTDGTGTSILQSALRRQQKRMEKEEGEKLVFHGFFAFGWGALFSCRVMFT